MSNAALIGTAAAFACVVAVAAVAALYLWNKSRSGDAPQFFSSRARRLAFVERIGLDGGRRLLLIRRDNVEHLVMVGGPIDVVIESGIKVSPAVLARDADYKLDQAGDAKNGAGRRDLDVAAFAPIPQPARTQAAASSFLGEEPFDLTPLSEVKAVR